MIIHAPDRGVDVLIIDDEVELRQLLAEFLDSNGFSTHSVGDGSAALQFLDENPPPAIIILDIMMSPMDGFTFLAHLPAHLASVPVIVWTASHRLGDHPPARAQRSFTKPIDMAELLGAVKEFVALRKH